MELRSSTCGCCSWGRWWSADCRSDITSIVVIAPQWGWLGDFCEKKRGNNTRDYSELFLPIYIGTTKERKKEEKRKRIICARDAHCKHSTSKKASERKSMLWRKDGDREEKTSLFWLFGISSLPASLSSIRTIMTREDWRGEKHNILSDILFFSLPRTKTERESETEEARKKF